MSHTLQGKFRPKNPDKYKGDVSDILYRSSWELEFMKWCDRCEQVILWQSEEKRIGYYDPVMKKHRTYYPDFLVKYKTHDGEVRVEMVEIKPLRQVKGPPKEPKKRTANWMREINTYVTNTAKWEAAEKYCESKDWKFRLLTERNVNKWKLL